MIGRSRFAAAAALLVSLTCGEVSLLNAEPVRAHTLRAAARLKGAEAAHLLVQTSRRARIPGRTCAARILIGTAIGAGVGAIVGASMAKGNRESGALFGAFLFTPLGAGFGYKACRP